MRFIAAVTAPLGFYVAVTGTVKSRQLHAAINSRLNTTTFHDLLAWRQAARRTPPPSQLVSPSTATRGAPQTVIAIYGNVCG